MSRVQNFLKKIFSSRKQKRKVSRVPKVINQRSLPSRRSLPNHHSLPNLRQNHSSPDLEPSPELCPFCQKPQKRSKWCEQCQEFPTPFIETDTDCESTSPTQPAQGDASKGIPYGICRKCFNPKTSQWWCNYCESLAFRAEFGKWSSGNKVINEMIRKSQLNAVDELNYLEWVNYDEFEDVQLVVESGMGKLHTAIWKTGPRIKYNQDLGEWVRDNDITIALKELNDSTKMTDDYIKKIEQYASCNATGSNILQCFGLTFNPVTKNYLLIIDYCEHGNLNQYLDKHHANVTWERRLAILHSLSATVFNLHEQKIFHQNLHGGNILMGLGPPMIADVGLCIPAYERSDTKNIYGVLPFVAPEVLRGNAYTAAADVYSLGMLMWQLASGKRPFHNRAHDVHLTIDIRNRIRPKVINGLPECYQEFMERCWNDDPRERPTSSEVYSIVGIWFNQMMFVPGSEIGKQFWEAEDFRKYRNMSDDMNDEKHPKAIYSSRLLSFPKAFYDKFEINGTNSEQTRIVADEKSINEEEQDVLVTPIDNKEHREEEQEQEQDLSATPTDSKKHREEEQEQDLSATPTDSNKYREEEQKQDKDVPAMPIDSKTSSGEEQEQDLPATPIDSRKYREEEQEQEQDKNMPVMPIDSTQYSEQEQEQDLSATSTDRYHEEERKQDKDVLVMPIDSKKYNGEEQEQEQDLPATSTDKYREEEQMQDKDVPVMPIDSKTSSEEEQEQDLPATPIDSKTSSEEEQEQDLPATPIDNRKYREQEQEKDTLLTLIDSRKYREEEQEQEEEEEEEEEKGLPAMPIYSKKHREEEQEQEQDVPTPLIDDKKYEQGFPTMPIDSKKYRFSVDYYYGHDYD